MRPNSAGSGNPHNNAIGALTVLAIRTVRAARRERQLQEEKQVGPCPGQRARRAHQTGGVQQSGLRGPVIASPSAVEQGERCPAVHVGSGKIEGRA